MSKYLDELWAKRRATMKARQDHIKKCYWCSPMRTGRGLSECSEGKRLYQAAKDALAVLSIMESG